MKNKKHTIFLILVLMIFSASYAQVEFDGGYIKTQSGKYIELPELQCYNLKINKLSEGFEGHFKSLRKRGEYYIVNSQRNRMVTIRKNNFKGIVIKGHYKIELFSLHPLVEKRIGRNYTIIKNDGPATENRPYYVPGEQIEVRTKSLGTDSYYWQPRLSLPRGEYVAWIGSSFWIFKIE